jgi:hypothetical protein
MALYTFKVSSFSKTRGEFFNQMKNSQLLKDDTAAWALDA